MKYPLNPYYIISQYYYYYCEEDRILAIKEQPVFILNYNELGNETEFHSLKTHGYQRLQVWRASLRISMYVLAYLVKVCVG